MQKLAAAAVSVAASQPRPVAVTRNELAVLLQAAVLQPHAQRAAPPVAVPRLRLLPLQRRLQRRQSKTLRSQLRDLSRLLRVIVPSMNDVELVHKKWACRV